MKVSTFHLEIGDLFIVYFSYAWLSMQHSLICTVCSVCWDVFVLGLHLCDSSGACVSATDYLILLQLSGE